MLYIVARIIAFPLYLIPLKIGVHLGALFGRITYYILPGERKKAIKHLNIAFGSEKSRQEISKIAKSMFSNLGRNAMEWISSPKIDKKWLIDHIEPTGLENINRAHERGKGVIFLINHFGNWEMMGFFLANIGYAGTSIAKRFYIESFNKLLVRMRADKGVGIVYRDESPKKILRLLKNNGYVAILIDQDVRSVEGVFVDFFGKAAYTPSGLAKVAQKTGAAIVPVFLIRKKNDRFKFVAEKEIDVALSGNEERDTIINTAKCTKAVESYIRKYPDHWVWIHRRWKTRPEDLK